MFELKDLMREVPAGSVRTRLGTVVSVAGERMVNVDGVPLRASWADPMIVRDGDPVDVEFTSSGRGQSTVHVRSRTTIQPRARTGVVASATAGAETITVLTEDDQMITAQPVGGPYASGDEVHLDWGAGIPRVLGLTRYQVTTPTPEPSPPPPVPISPPPSAPITGKTSAAATLSRTRGPNGWGTHAGDGGKVYQGTWAGATVTGAFFYGTPFRSLDDGRRITRVTFQIGRHLTVGASGAKTFNFYAHTHPHQPGGDTNRVGAPHPVTLQPGERAHEIELPTHIASSIISSGGGIAVAGEPYAAIEGRTHLTPDVGTLTFYWTK